MIEIDLASQQQPSTPQTLPVTVVGIGGAGANILDTIALEGLTGDEIVKREFDTGVPIVYRFNADTTIAAKEILAIEAVPAL